MFAEELTKVSGQFVYCENELQFVENLLTLSAEKKWQHICCWENKLQTLLRNCEFPFQANDHNFEETEAGITLCEALIARNGSVLMSSAQSSGRRLSVFTHAQDRKSVVKGKSVSVRVVLGGRRIIQKKKQKIQNI